MKKRKPEDNEDVHDDNEDDGDGFWIIHGSSKKQHTEESNVTSNSNASPESRELSYECWHIPSVEDIYETPNESLETLVKQSLQA